MKQEAMLKFRQGLCYPKNRSIRAVTRRIRVTLKVGGIDHERTVINE